MRWLGPGVLGLVGGKEIQPGEIVPEGAIDPARAERLQKAGKLEIEAPKKAKAKEAPKTDALAKAEDKPKKPKRKKKK